MLSVLIFIFLINFFNKADIFEMSIKFVNDKNNHNNFSFESCLHSILPLSRLKKEGGGVPFYCTLFCPVECEKTSSPLIIINKG